MINARRRSDRQSLQRRSSMRMARSGRAVFLAATFSGCAGAHLANENSGVRAEIEQLHRLDVEAPLADSADRLEELWDSGAVRIQPGQPVEVGRGVIHADDKRWETNDARPRTLCYQSEIQDLQIAGDWAFEWGYFSYRDSTDSTA